MSEFDSILFDFDGVLIDSEPMHWACWAEVLAPLGVTLEWEWYCAECIGIDDREMLRVMAERATPPRNWQTLWEQYPVKQQLFHSRMIAAPPFSPELPALLERLHREFKLAVVTSSGRAEIEPLLEVAKLRHYFQTLVCARDAPRHKPAPDPYLLAAAQLEAKTPLVLEDSAAGIASGRAAGFEVLPVKHANDVPALLRRRLGW
jgi:HAD superfamily hydrolase (TIGR01509 family)